MLMVGRACLGNPFIFREINAYLLNGKQLPQASPQEKIEVMKRHIQKICQYKGERIGMKEARKHIAYYLKGFYGASSFRNEAGKLCTYEDFLCLIDKIAVFLKI